jgi:hypothetical protein
LRNAKRSKPVKSVIPRAHALERRLNPEAVQQLLDDYRTGISSNQLAVRYCLSRGSVQRLLRESGVPRRYQAMIDLEVDQASELYRSGLTISEVAARLNRPWSTVQTALTRRDVVMRSRHDYRSGRNG